MHYPTQIIDMHTHMFNADYLPLRGIFRSRGVPRTLAGLIARFSWALTKTARFSAIKQAPLPPGMMLLGNANKDIQDHTGSTAPYIDALVTDGASLYDFILSSDLFQKSEYAKTLSDGVTDNLSPDISFGADVYKLYCDIHEVVGDELSARELGLMQLQIRAKSKNKSSKKAGLLWRGIRAMLRRLLEKIISLVENAIDLIDFIWNMTRPENKLLERLQNYYKGRGVSATLVHHMMDMQHPYSLPPNRHEDGKMPLDYYPHPKKRASQLSQMQGLSQSLNGRLIGFSAFDPIRFLQKGSSSKDIEARLNEALSYGVKGFKVYPPMGYRPIGNLQPGLDYIMRVFFDFCRDRDIPIFTHCTPEGFATSKDSHSGLNSDPRYWRELLSTPGYENLRVCLGHAGGAFYSVADKMTSYGWTAKSETEWAHEDNYARHVVDLCRTFPNVFCEIANMDVILHDSKAHSAMQRNLTSAVTAPADSRSYLFREKIMYGTDWHMVGMVNDVIAYFDVLVAMFNHKDLKPVLPAFFAENALKYLKIDGATS